MASSIVEEEEVAAEVEAVQAVYGDDCVVLQSYPPHLHLLLKPRTADVTSQQFVEAVIGLRAGSQYPKEPPHIDLIDSKGLDEQRQKELMSCIQDKACELSCYLMLVALCEELELEFHGFFIEPRLSVGSISLGRLEATAENHFPIMLFSPLLLLEGV
ncbi:hypothetical protein CMV_012158 [Castanea mollissima]|uniref:RWD domain-containing protein n=1 Tax=Castanea mollissima TaxID=60419 RepID=A0A8J4VZH3_9ROSI|nr:hypothetical protein CMV_012158 [Castanea mollissima]